MNSFSQNATEGDINIRDFKSQHDNVDEWPLMHSPLPVLSIISLYIVFVTKVGPSYMKHRSPFTLRSILLVYNTAQVIISILLFGLGCNLLFSYGYSHTDTCPMELEEARRRISAANYYYLLAKLSELFDTIFFVLRKKQNQVSFLHVYHHSNMALATWMSLKIEPSYSAVFGTTLNCLVHIVMYTYYGLSAFPHLSKYLWWKKYITKFQIIQFVIIIAQINITYLFSKCPPSAFIFGLVMFNAFTFLILFANFYKKSYNKESQPTVSNAMKESEKHENGITDIKKNNGTSDIVNKRNIRYRN